MKKTFLCLISFLLVLCVASGTPVYANSHGAVYFRNSAAKKQIALTFDDGPHPRYTPRILSILERFHVTATFFIIGINAERYPDTLKQIAESGCEIGNHTYSHTSLLHRSSKEIRKEIEDCQQVIERLVGVRTSLFRPPQGANSPCVKTVSRELEYDVILWSIDTEDWALTPSREIYQDLIKNLKGGDIILMHDYVSGGNTTCDALERIIPDLLSRGYEFVTVSELIG